MMQMVGVLEVMLRFLGTVMGTWTLQDRSLDCWKTQLRGIASRLATLMVRVL